MQRFVKTSTLATTSDGAVLLAYDTDRATMCVIKRTRLSRSTHAAIASEVRAYDVLHAKASDHILRCYGSHMDRKRTHHYLLLEHCAKGDLYNHLHDLPMHKCTPELAQQYFMQIARGLAAIHSCDLAHRDLSLENVFVDANGQLKIGDFGLATPLAATATHAVGKSYYMAPEMHTSGDYSAATVDVWSLGIVLWMLLTGVTLVESSSEADEVFGFLQRVGIRTLVRAWGLALPSDAVEMLALLLVADPALRPSMATVLQHPYCQPHTTGDVSSR
ncbi:serine/threonine protein kinase [Saprolegnia parasitica CBS 223.65]|uniref:Serine/threonine protein kinase n=1 Tax=Saprolegnia parasitica (strain CBS 223.65) TaxID=695850 RepID=A0A067C8P1_SAPPC|nr:serine/threonine protein kinase [Saprolegnia parasitica CBS 223.65]KDO27129.1 serine/threonine protein kinase [Saprolegnia parasitica CBS 223.65]|eukprot:XP_012202262.1 serine/threonine protein kinase [Saprolegnia parasitica CBS 223.65]